jgi:hypothetical protein
LQRGIEGNFSINYSIAAAIWQGSFCHFIMSNAAAYALRAENCFRACIKNLTKGTASLKYCHIVI